MKSITIYTDGACKGNPGKGGWGYVAILDDTEFMQYGGNRYTTNNEMELEALRQALSFSPKHLRVIVFSDSKYVVDGINIFLPQWKRNGWKTSSNDKVKNLELWKDIDERIREFKIEPQINWIKGHANHPMNEKADRLANLGAEIYI